MRLLKLLIAAAGSLILIPAANSAEGIERDGYWGGIDIGAGSVDLSYNGGSNHGTKFFLGFKGGYTINPHLLVGVELSGWLYEAVDLNDPSRGRD